MVLWSSGVGLGILVVGWPSGSGALFNLDLIVVGDLDVPDSLWSLGPEVPRRAPLVGLLALLSPPLSGVTVVKLWMVTIVAVAGVGMYRHLRDVPLPPRAGGAIAFALSPYLLTRIGVGHLGLATAMALVPWSASTLLRPFDRWRTTVLWLMAFALCGYFGLVVFAPLLLVGFAADRRWPRPGQVLAAAATQTPWLLPALLALGSAGPAAGSSVFPSDVDTVGEAFLVVAGYGFWQPVNQIGIRSLGTIAVTMVLLALAAVGLRFSGSRLRRRLVAVGVLGWAVAVASAVPGLSTGLDAVTDLAVFSPWRESHRLAGLAVFGLIALAARGVAAATAPGSVRSWIGGAVLAAAGFAMVGSSLWGLDDRVDPVAIPASWEHVADIVEDRPGTVLALPWNQYFDVRIAGGRRAHHPIPFLLGGDVVFNHELGLADGGRVSRDDREERVPGLLAALRLEAPVASELAELGIRWVAVLPDLDRPDLDRLRESEDFEAVVDEPEIALFELRAWSEADGSSGDWGPGTSAVAAADGAWLLGVIAFVRSRRRRDP